MTRDRDKGAIRFTEEEMERMAADDPDFPPLTQDELREAVAVSASGRRKRPISIRVDEETLERFREKYPRYQTKMNDVLVAFESGTLVEVPGEWKDFFAGCDLTHEVRRIVAEHIRRMRHREHRLRESPFVPASAARSRVIRDGDRATNWSRAFVQVGAHAT